MLVRIIKDWDSPDLLRQTPGGLGVWEDDTYTLEPVSECDHVVVLNRVPDSTTVTCPPEHIWAIMQEPPVREYDWLIKGYKDFSWVITSNEKLTGEKFIFDSLALPWHVNKTYDELRQSAVNADDKQDRVSWITSARKDRPGHRNRLDFLRVLQRGLDFDLFGRGFKPIADKWDGIYPYKYSIAVENNRCNYYWTEKLSDCYLAWTMPVYCGCTNIDSFFPEDSMIKVDIDNPAEAVSIINEAVSSNLWKRNIDAIEHARNLVLEKFQFFPFVSSLIRRNPAHTQKRQINLPELPYAYPRSMTARLKKTLWSMMGSRK